MQRGGVRGGWEHTLNFSSVSLKMEDAARTTFSSILVAIHKGGHFSFAFDRKFANDCGWVVAQDSDCWAMRASLLYVCAFEVFDHRRTTVVSAHSTTHLALKCRERVDWHPGVAP